LTTYLRSAQIVRINREQVLRFGGFYSPHNDNIANESSLEYVVQVVQGELFGVDLFPTLYDKAAAYCYHIIQDHIFHDGNKRTGMMCAFLFLQINNIPGFAYPAVSEYEIVKLALKVAKGAVDVKEIARWFKRITKTGR